MFLPKIRAICLFMGRIRRTNERTFCAAKPEWGFPHSGCILQKQDAFQGLTVPTGFSLSVGHFAQKSRDGDFPISDTFFKGGILFKGLPFRLVRKNRAGDFPRPILEAFFGDTGERNGAGRCWWARGRQKGNALLFSPSTLRLSQIL